MNALIATRGKERGTESSGTFRETKRDRNNSCTTRIARCIICCLCRWGCSAIVSINTFTPYIAIYLRIETCLALLTITCSSHPGLARRTPSFSGIGSARPTHRQCWKTGERVDAEINEFRISGSRSATTGGGLTAVTNGSPVMIPTVRGHITGTCDADGCFLLLRIMNDHCWNELLGLFRAFIVSL